MTTELKGGNTDETVEAAPMDSSAEPSEKIAASNCLGVWDEDSGRFVDFHEMAQGMEMYDFTVSPEEYDQIVAICLEPPGPVSEGMLDLIRAAKKWGFA